jgi:FkbM family methyltransferase
MKNAPKLIKEHSLRSLDACMNEKCKTLDIDCLGMRFHLSNYSFCSVREIYARRIYFPADNWIPKRGDFVIDLGANVGMVTLLCSKLGADVVAVEAQNGFILCIKENLSKNNCLDRVRAIHGLVGSGSGVFSSEKNFDRADHYDGVLPNTISMEDILNIYPNRRVHLLKIDIEGSEFSLFDNKLDWLSSVDRIAMEVHSAFGDPDVILDKLEAHGFYAKLYDERRHPVATLRDEGDNGLIFSARN